MKFLFLLGFISIAAVGTIVFMKQQANGPLPKLVDPSLKINKSKRKLEVFDQGRLLRTYEISLGFAPDGDKEVEGDGKTPEGEFYVFTKNPESAFFLSLGLSYPNSEDAGRGLRDGIISQAEHDEIVDAIGNKLMPPQKTKLGGEIYIHGGGCQKDWTAGCVALENEKMKELFDAIEVGTPVFIVPK
jgi:murein L,D-transpeptidase YafK